jgi:penicillin amidase
MKRYHRFFRPALFTISALLLVGVASVVWILFGSLPDYVGQASVSGLKDPVRIYRDPHGVPHIFASSMNDAARALGYVHASERLFQMEMQRRAGQGRLSEVVGPSMLGVDKFIRTLQLYPLAQSSVSSLSPEAQEYFTAYADGVNAWLDQHHHELPPEFALLGFRPEPWQPADSLVWGKLMALQLSHNYKLEMLRATIAKKLTPLQIHGLFPPYGDAPVTIPGTGSVKKQTLLAPDPHLTPADALAQITGLDHAASNEWVIAGSRTDTGKPILANDPHLSLTIPVLWYLVRIVTPDLTVKGATVPGLPVVLLGQNNSVAWGMTTTGSDVQDLFIETIDPKDPTHYLTPKGSMPFDTHTEVIHVKGQDDVTLNIRTTRHGPILSDIETDMAAVAGPGKVMALAFTGLRGDDRSAETLMRINRVASWQDFLNAFKMYQAPPQNVVFASVKGDIGFINPGLLPIRKKGDGLMPADGASGIYDWVGTVPFEQLPQTSNPAAGVIFNANNALVGTDFKAYLGIDWEEPFRAERLQDFFNQHDKQTFEMSQQLQADHVSLAARQLLQPLLRQKPTNHEAQAALDMLRGWDGVMNRDRPEPLIFEAWLYQMHQLLFASAVGEQLEEKGPYAATSIAYILTHDGSGWCEKKDCDNIILQALDDALTMIKARDGADMKAWRWGQEHQVFLKNKVFTHVPYFHTLSDINLPSSGDFYTLDRGGSFEYDAEHPFARTHGGGYRGVYDLADPSRSRFMIATGESGHILSKHYIDLAPLWNDVESITLTGTAEDFAKQGAELLTLTP